MVMSTRKEWMVVVWSSGMGIAIRPKVQARACSCLILLLTGKNQAEKIIVFLCCLYIFSVKNTTHRKNF